MKTLLLSLIATVAFSSGWTTCNMSSSINKTGLAKTEAMVLVAQETPTFLIISIDKDTYVFQKQGSDTSIDNVHFNVYKNGIGVRVLVYDNFKGGVRIINEHETIDFTSCTKD